MNFSELIEWAGRMHLESLGKKVEDLTGDQARGLLIRLLQSDGAPREVIDYFLKASRDEINNELREAWEWDIEDTSILNQPGVKTGRWPTDKPNRSNIPRPIGECQDCARGGPENCNGCMD